MNDPNLPQSRKQIEDLTLLVRNFNHPIKGVSSRTPSVSSIQRQFSDQLRISIEEEEDGVATDGQPYRDRSASRTLMTAASHSVVSTFTDDQGLATTENSSTTTTATSNSTDFEDRRFNSQKADPLEVDAEGKIAAYVTFDEFFDAIKKANKANDQFVNFPLD